MGNRGDGGSSERNYRHGQRDRRRSGRAESSGTAIVHGALALHGRIVDLAIGGLTLLVDGIVAEPAVGHRVRVVARLDGPGRWFHLTGSVARIESRGSATALVIELTGVPHDYEDLVQNELLSGLECARDPQILLVDSSRGRRALVAAAFRAVGCRVIEASSPLEAIAAIDQSRLHLRAVVIADTELASRAADLRRFLHEAYPRVPLVVVGDGRRTREHLTVDRFPDLALQVQSLVAMHRQIGARA